MFLIFLLTFALATPDLRTTVHFKAVPKDGCAIVDITYAGVREAQSVYVEAEGNAKGTFYVKAERDHVVRIWRCSDKPIKAEDVTLRLDTE